MTTKHAAHILLRGIFTRIGWNAPAWTRSSEIFWRTEHNGWQTMRYFSVTEYAPRLIRLRNDLLVAATRPYWQLEIPSWYRFELTFHESEITRELGGEMHAFCESLPLEGHGRPAIYWPLFQGKQSFPHYAWTTIAEKFYQTGESSPNAVPLSAVRRRRPRTGNISLN